MDITKLQKLREQTSASILECRKALVESNDDLDKAVELLKSWGQAVSSKRDARTTGDGMIASYVHNTGKIAALVELRCETDFVARNEEFKKLGYTLAMQVTAMNPTYVKPEGSTEVENKEDYLYLQSCITDSSQTIQQLIESHASKFGEKIEVTRFTRFQI